jgi:prolyl 4-hydroxylase
MKENITEIYNFLSNEECDFLIQRAQRDLKEMSVLGAGEKPHSDYRVAQGTWIPDGEDCAKDFRKKISEVTNLPAENMESLHIVKYDVGGEYKVHQDFFHPNTDYYDVEVAKGGQRIISVLIYLNDDFKGGETDFPKWGRTIKPEKNKLVIWKNVKDNGELEYDSLHAGLPVIEGTKYIGIIWIRKDIFTNSPVAPKLNPEPEPSIRLDKPSLYEAEL